MNCRAILGILLLLSGLAGCSDSSQPVVSGSDLRGEVVDALGRPVDGATVVLEYAADPPAGSAYDKPQTGIRFELPATGPVRIWISSYCDGDTVRLLVDGELPGGLYTMIWDGRDRAGRTVPDGVYRWHVVTAAQERHQAMVLFHLGYRNLPAGEIVAPLAVTDAHGRFALDQACLPLGFTFDRTDEAGAPIGLSTIRRTVRVWACARAGDPLTPGPLVTVDPETGALANVTLGD